MTLLRSAFTSAGLLAGGLLATTSDTADAQIRVQIGGGHGGHGHGVQRSTSTYYGGSNFRSGDYGGYSPSYGYSASRYGYSGSRYGYLGSRYGNSGSHYGHSGSSYSAGRRHGGWHDTSHYDYHPTTVVPHGNHYHVVPGHYDYHQSGHRH